MKEVKNYKPHFDELLEQANMDKTRLPTEMLLAIQRFRHAHKVTAEVAPALQRKFFVLLVQTDAVISASVYEYLKDKIKPTKIDKVKLLSMKAKALRLKLKQEFNK